MDEAWEKGRLAASNGDPISDNDYEEGTAEWETWREGWHSAKERDDDDELIED